MILVIAIAVLVYRLKLHRATLFVLYLSLQCRHVVTRFRIFFSRSVGAYMCEAHFTRLF